MVSLYPVIHELSLLQTEIPDLWSLISVKNICSFIASNKDWPAVHIAAFFGWDVWNEPAFARFVINRFFSRKNQSFDKFFSRLSHRNIDQTNPANGEVPLHQAVRNRPLYRNDGLIDWLIDQIEFRDKFSLTFMGKKRDFFEFFHFFFIKNQCFLCSIFQLFLKEILRIVCFRVVFKVKRGHFNTIVKLLELNCRLDIVNHLGDSVFHYAATTSVEIIKVRGEWPKVVAFHTENVDLFVGELFHGWLIDWLVGGWLMNWCFVVDWLID